MVYEFIEKRLKRFLKFFPENIYGIFDYAEYRKSKERNLFMKHRFLTFLCACRRVAKQTVGLSNKKIVDGLSTISKLCRYNLCMVLLFFWLIGDHRAGLRTRFPNNGICFPVRLWNVLCGVFGAFL